MAKLEHKDIIGADAVHPAAYIQTADPGAVGPGKAWLDTTGGAGAYVLKIRNTGDTAWDIAGLAAAGANGQRMAIKSLEELTTIAAAATTDTAVQFPAGSTRLGVSVRVTVAVTCTSVFDVGDSGLATRFGTGVSKAAATTTKGNIAPYVDAAALAVRITPDTTPTTNAGRVRVTIFYIETTPATA